MNEQLSYSTLRSPSKTRIRHSKIKKEHLVPLTCAAINISLGKEQWRTIKVLLDSGASATIVSKAIIAKLRQKAESPTSWETAAGAFRTTGTESST